MLLVRNVWNVILYITIIQIVKVINMIGQTFLTLLLVIMHKPLQETMSGGQVQEIGIQEMAIQLLVILTTPIGV